MTSVIFDLDGTLVDSERAIAASIRHVLTSLGREEVGQGDLRWAIGPPLPELMRQLLSDADPVAISRAVAIYRTHHETVCLTHAAVYPGIPDLLSRLTASGCRLFVATSKLRTLAEHVLAHFDLRQHLTSVSGPEPDGRLSAKADVIEHVVRTQGLDPSDTIMVGDRAGDILGARAHGLRSVAVAYGYGDRAELEGARPDAICERPEELLRTLAALSATHVPPSGV